MRPLSRWSATHVWSNAPEASIPRYVRALFASHLVLASEAEEIFPDVSGEHKLKSSVNGLPPFLTYKILMHYNFLVAVT